MRKKTKPDYDGFCSSDVADQLYLNLLPLQLQHKVQLHSTFKKSVKLENLQLQYHERICVYLLSSSIQMSPRFLFSSKLYLGFLSQNPYVTQLHTAEGLCSFIQSKYKQSLWKDPHFSKREIQIFSIPEAAGMALTVCELQLMTKASCLHSKEVLTLCSTFDLI